ncbi:Zinc finger protein 782 [Eumeta japonica]|uniref:Zinc finger protein 782 n=1 Tax=Eumeta variegata TaxID=151549 RepID=A0A4C1YCQ0_EUMVA|nr:Zinc finger protein 782 [Eumeta japonica]
MFLRDDKTQHACHTRSVRGTDTIGVNAIVMKAKEIEDVRVLRFKLIVSENSRYSILGYYSIFVLARSALRNEVEDQLGEDTAVLSGASSVMRSCSRTLKADGEIYECDYCKYTSVRKSDLAKHMRVHIGKKRYKCQQCEYSSYRMSALKAHIRTHTGERPFKCEHCEYSANHITTLKVHMRTHTGERPFKCEHCEYSANQITTLKVHMRTHTGERPFKCEHCEYSANQMSTLKVHIRTHTGERPFKCEHCEYSANQMRTLKVHMYIHTGERPLKCYLKVHMRTHTGERPYKCEQCEYSATRLGYLKVHMRTHTEERPYKCEQSEYGAPHTNNHRHAHALSRQRRLLVRAKMTKNDLWNTLSMQEDSIDSIVERKIRGSAVGCMLHVNACFRQASTMDFRELTPHTIQYLETRTHNKYVKRCRYLSPSPVRRSGASTPSYGSVEEGLDSTS